MHAVICLNSVGKYSELYDAQAVWSLIHDTAAPQPISPEVFDQIEASICSFEGATTQAPSSSSVTVLSVLMASLGAFTDVKSTLSSLTKILPITTTTSPAKLSAATVKANDTPMKTLLIFKPTRGPFLSQSVYGLMKDATQKEGLPAEEQGPKAASTTSNSTGSLPASKKYIKFIEGNSKPIGSGQTTGMGLMAEDEQDRASTFWAILWGKCPGMYQG
ncbi:hypothetical protein ARMSODRAFT_1017304 [Armillaria solidipes]|uniref:Uncharacterized protein n=1 Tax=Armillaria solidipes TaxID=1076256 RepID=A0A2H3BP33_9AGAR|nr:hypothetical protein ARMSODRAFT_1017304 [Armillaria solidipes]